MAYNIGLKDLEPRWNLSFVAYNIGLKDSRLQIEKPKVKPLLDLV